MIAESKKIPGVVVSGRTKDNKSSWTLISSGDKKSLGTKIQAARTRASRRRGGAGAPSLPPVLNTSPTIGHTFRFTNTANSTALAISGALLQGALGVMGTATNSTVRPWATSVRIHKITIWPSAGSNPPIAPGVEWGAVSSTVKDEGKYTGLPYGITEERAMISRPPKKSVCSDWLSLQATGITTLFYITAPAGSIMDISLSYTLANVFVTSNAITTATAVIGTVYYLALDGNSSHNWGPIGLPTTW